MAFICPECNHSSLMIETGIELRPDSRSDEITLQIVKCSRCSFSGAAVYEESRRGGLDDESWSHTGYRLAESDLRAMRALLRQCRDKKNPRCQCVAHRTLGRRETSGRWVGIDGDVLGAFALRRA